jgi:hypothetical protein
VFGSFAVLLSNPPHVNKNNERSMAKEGCKGFNGRNSLFVLLIADCDLD